MPTKKKKTPATFAPEPKTGDVTIYQPGPTPEQLQAQGFALVEDLTPKGVEGFNVYRLSSEQFADGPGLYEAQIDEDGQVKKVWKV